MNADRNFGGLNARLEQLFRDLERFFNWIPSSKFRNRIEMFAQSVGPNNVDDLVALVFCEASEWHSRRLENNFFRTAFRTRWGSAVVSWDIEKRPQKGPLAVSCEKADVNSLTEIELEATFFRYLAGHPKEREHRARLSDSEILWEDTLLRALDRERQRWRREAKRPSRQLGRSELPEYGREDPVTQFASSELDHAIGDIIRDIRLFVEEHFGEDGRVLLQARFEQGLGFKEIANIVGNGHGVVVLRQRAKRMKDAIRAKFGHIIKALTQE